MSSLEEALWPLIPDDFSPGSTITQAKLEALELRLRKEIAKHQHLGQNDQEGVALGTAALQNGSISTDKLQTACVTTEKLANGAVTHNEIADGSVVNSKLGAHCVGRSKLAFGCVSEDELDTSLLNTLVARVLAALGSDLDGPTTAGLIIWMDGGETIRPPSGAKNWREFILGDSVDEGGRAGLVLSKAAEIVGPDGIVVNTSAPLDLFNERYDDNKKNSAAKDQVDESSPARDTVDFTLDDPVNGEVKGSAAVEGNGAFTDDGKSFTVRPGYPMNAKERVAALNLLYNMGVVDDSASIDDIDDRVAKHPILEDVLNRPSAVPAGYGLAGARNIKQVTRLKPEEGVAPPRVHIEFEVAYKSPDYLVGVTLDYPRLVDLRGKLTPMVVARGAKYCDIAFHSTLPESNTCTFSIAIHGLLDRKPRF